MNETHYELLSTLDASFISMEDPSAHMHVGSVGLIDAEPFRLPGGDLDFERIEAQLMRILPQCERLRQKVWWPAGGPPVWIDDPDFDPAYHVRRAALPSPGSGREFKNLVGDLLSRPLVSSKPLWEAWIVEGVDGGRQFSVIWKLHHCLADGVGVREILFGYLGFAPSSEPPPVSPEYAPRPAPSLARLHLETAQRRIEHARDTSEQIQEFLKTGDLRAAATDLVSGVFQLGEALMRTTASTPLNGELTPRRRIDWTSCEFGTLQSIRRESGAKINDVVLAAVCGAVRRFFLDRGLAVDELPFQVMVPVNMRNGTQPAAGNQVTAVVVPLPLFETDPRRRLRTIAKATLHAKSSGQIAAGDWVLRAADWAGVHVPRTLSQILAQHLPANLVVTNIPGPPVPQYMLDAKVEGSYPVVPLAPGQGLGVALYSYNGTMYWGFNADREKLPDLAQFTRAVELEIGRLHHAHTPIPVRTRAPLRAVPTPSETDRPRTRAQRKRRKPAARQASAD